MKYHLHENGWTTIIEDVDLKNPQKEDINLIARLVAKNTLVIIKKQFLTIEEELRVLKMFKNPSTLFPPANDGSPPSGDALHCTMPNTEGLLCRVTAEPDQYGAVGVAGHIPEMGWHNDHPWRPDLPNVVWLRAVKGTNGSKTTWTNNVLAYNGLDQETKDILEPLEAVLMKDNDFDVTSYWQDENGRFWPPGVVVEGSRLKVVHTNIAGNKGLNFPFTQFHTLIGMPHDQARRLIEKIGDHITQEKYCYTHEWELGDVIITDNRLGIHKRHRFKNIANRLLHRGIFDYPDQDYNERIL